MAEKTVEAKQTIEERKDTAPSGMSGYSSLREGNSPERSSRRDLEESFALNQSVREAQRQAEDLLEDQIRKLESEKIQLIKRLNSSLVELDRETYEKGDAEHKLQDKIRYIEDLNRRWEKANGLAGLISKNLEDDLKYQKMLNADLRKEIEEYENSREKMASDINGQEGSALKSRESIETMKKALHSAEESKINLEYQYSLCVSQLKLLTEEAEELLARNKRGDQDKHQLKEILGNLVAERDELIYRINDLTEKYELYVKEMSRESEEIHRANRNHSKVITASLLNESLEKFKLRRLGVGLSNIIKFSTYRSIVFRRLIEMKKFQEHWISMQQHRAFSIWRHSKIKWNNERRILKELLIKRNNKKLQTYFFLQWKKQYFKNSERANTQIDASRQIQALKLIQSRKNVREYFAKWHKISLKFKNRDMLLKRYVIEVDKKKKEAAMLVFLELIHKAKYDKKVSKLSLEVAEEKFKREMFARLKYNLQLEEDKLVRDSHTKLEDKHVQKSNSRFLKAATILFMTLNSRKQKDLTQEAMESLKFNNLIEKRNSVRLEISKELPNCSSLEQEHDEFLSQSKTQRKLNLIRAVINVFNKNLRNYFNRWYNVIPVYIQNSCTMKRILGRMCFNKQAAAFNTWRFQNYKATNKDMESKFTSRTHEIEGISENISSLDRHNKQNEIHMNKFTLTKLERIFHIFSRKSLSGRFFQFRNNAGYLSNVLRAGNRITRRLNKQKLERALQKYRNNVANIREEIYKENKINNLKHRLNQLFVLRCFREFRRVARNLRYGNLLILAIGNRMDKRHVSKKLNTWRKKAHMISKTKTEAENKTLLKKNNETVQELSQMEKSKKNKQDLVEEWGKRQKIQSTAVIQANFKLWLCKASMDCFKKWRENSRKSKIAELLLRRYCSKLENNSLRRAMSNWRSHVFLSHLRQNNEEMRKRIGRFETFTRISAVRIGETEAENRQIREIYNKIKRDHNLEEEKIEGTTKILGRLNGYCKKYSCAKKTLLDWVTTFRREKELMERAKNISKQFVGKYIHAKLKQLADHNKTKAETLKKWGNALHSIEHIQTRYALFRWRCRIKENRGEFHKAEAEKQQHKILNLNTQLQKLHDCADNTYQSEIIKRRTLKTLRAWLRQAAYQKILKLKAAQFEDSIRLIRISKSFSNWRGDYNVQERIQIKKEQADKHHKNRILKNSFLEWKNSHKNKVQLPKAIHSISKRHFLLNLIYSQEVLNQHHKTQDKDFERLKEKAGLNLGQLLQKLTATKIANSFCTIIDAVRARQMNRELIRRMIMRQYYKKLRDHIDIWRQNVAELKLRDEIEEKGDTASVVSQVIRRRDSVQKTGLPPLNSHANPSK